MFIEKIEIKNFRSIVDQAIKGNNLVIFVGKNDVGKSNVLRALNLFFNNETEVNTAFDFQSDFSKIAKIGKNKAKEILIRITFSPPETFRDHVKKVVWTKKWRENGTFLDGEKIRYGDGTEITNRSRLYTWIRRLKYHYVPAIKSNDYFSKLLSVLYETLYATIRADLQGAGKKFIEKIQEHTNTLSSEILARINLTSRIQLPENLSSLFSTLDFETFLKNDVISLRNRGDGIKVRHIPVILKFLADKEEMHHAMGAVRSNTIWGYEEPENNLELQQAFELSRNFNEYSSDIQIFLTTHSAAFYSVEASAPVITKYYASKRPQDSSTEYAIIADSQLEQTDSEMGLMPLVAPYIKKKADENTRLVDLINELQSETKPVVLTEGPTDKTILENSWKILRPGKKMPFLVQQAWDCFFIGNTFKRCGMFQKQKDRLFIGMLDFDEAYEVWERTKELTDKYNVVETDPAKGLTLKNKKHKAYLFLLPIPTNRATYASVEYGKHSRLSIELLFSDDKLEGYCEEKACIGGGTVKKVLDDKKDAFAGRIKDFLTGDLANINNIFVHIEKIVGGAL